MKKFKDEFIPRVKNLSDDEFMIYKQACSRSKIESMVLRYFSMDKGSQKTALGKVLDTYLALDNPKWHGWKDFILSSNMYNDFMKDPAFCDYNKDQLALEDISRWRWMHTHRRAGYSVAFTVFDCTGQDILQDSISRIVKRKTRYDVGYSYIMAYLIYTNNLHGISQWVNEGGVNKTDVIYHTQGVVNALKKIYQKYGLSEAFKIIAMTPKGAKMALTRLGYSISTQVSISTLVEKTLVQESLKSIIEYNPGTILMIDQELLTKEHWKIALGKSGLLIKDMPEKYMDQELCDIASSKALSSNRYIPIEFQNKAIMMQAILDGNDNGLKYIKE